MNDPVTNKSEVVTQADFENKVQTGFDDPVIDSQSVFRQLLKSMSEPGIVSTTKHIRAYPQVLYPASYVIALGLFDQDTLVFLGESLQTPENITTLRFQVSLNATDNPSEADFIICNEDEIPRLDQLNMGNDEYPDQSCTLIIQSKSFEKGERYSATGPGIETNRIVQCSALTHQLYESRKAMTTQFPLGVDIIFTHKNQFFCLPRTTKLALENH